MTMLMLSNTPVSASMAIETQRLLESPNSTVATPNPATPQRSVLPARRIGGR